MKEVFYSLSRLPNFKGKLFLAEKAFNAFKQEIKSDHTGLMSYGHLMSLNLQDRIQRRMFVKHCHEPETEKLFEKYFKDSKCFLDIGANVGYFTLMGKSINPKLKIYSFEPNPNNVERLRKNISLNKFNDVVVSSQCISDVNTEVTFAVPPENESGWGRIENDHLPLDNFKKITTQAVTLDSMLESDYFKNDIPDLLKVDIEGNEMKLINGGIKFLEKFHPVICLELNEPCLNESNTSSEEIISKLKSLNYECFYISGDKLLKTEKAIVNYKYLNYFFIASK